MLFGLFKRKKKEKSIIQATHEGRLFINFCDLIKDEKVKKIINDFPQTCIAKQINFRNKMIREQQNELILNNGKKEPIDYEANLSEIYEHFCNLSYTHYDVKEMIKSIEENVISQFCEMALDDCENQDYTIDEFKKYLAKEVIGGYKPM